MELQLLLPALLLLLVAVPVVLIQAGKVKVALVVPVVVDEVQHHRGVEVLALPGKDIMVAVVALVLIPGLAAAAVLAEQDHPVVA